MVRSEGCTYQLKLVKKSNRLILRHFAKISKSTKALKDGNLSIPMGLIPPERTYPHHLPTLFNILPHAVNDVATHVLPCAALLLQPHQAHPARAHSTVRAPGLFLKRKEYIKYIPAHLRFSLQYMFVIRRKTHRVFFFFFNNPSQSFPFCTQELYLLDFGQSSHGRVTVDSILVDSTVI